MDEILFSVSLRNIFAACYTRQTVKRNDIVVFTLIVRSLHLNKGLGFRSESRLLRTTRVKSIRTGGVSDQSCQGGFFYVDLSIGRCSRTVLGKRAAENHVIQLLTLCDESCWRYPAA